MSKLLVVARRRGHWELDSSTPEQSSYSNCVVKDDCLTLEAFVYSSRFIPYCRKVAFDAL